MGNLYVGARAVLDRLGVEVIVPPRSSKKTLTLGVLHSPEFACLPLKVNLGNFLEACELGADTVVMAGGVGPCRFGYYAQVQREILHDLGKRLDMVVLEPPDKHVSELLDGIKQITGGSTWLQIIRALRFAWKKVAAVDRLEKTVQKIRAREIHCGDADRIFQASLTDLDQARNAGEVKAAEAAAAVRLQAVPVDSQRNCLKVGLVGEIYLLLEPFANFDLERHLGRLGVEVERSIYLSEWVNEHLFLGLVRGVPNSEEAKRKAQPYLNHFVGGHGQETVGQAIDFQDQGFDGIIQVAPFTCMPEIVARSQFGQIGQERDLPILSLVIDEHAGEAGLVTRLEAFVDLLRRRNMAAGFRFNSEKPGSGTLHRCEGSRKKEESYIGSVLGN